VTGYRYRGTQADLACGDKIGTPTGYERHRRADEDPCDDCRTARNTYLRAWQAAHPRSERSAVADRVRTRALRALAREHPTDYRRLLNAEWVAETGRDR
jgi:hypothetical protein